MEFGLFMELSVPRPWTAESERQGPTRTRSSRYASPTSWASTTSGRSSTTSSRSTRTARRPTSSSPRARCRPSASASVTAWSRACRSTRARSASRSAPRSLDILSGGRLELGTGRSATWTELGGFRANPDETKKTWDEFVRVIPKMWTQERFSWQGRAFSMPERAVLPKPVQKPHPPMWVAVTSPGTELDAADRGLGCLGLDARRVPGVREEGEGVPRPGARTAIRWARSSTTRCRRSTSSRAPKTATAPARPGSAWRASSATWRRSCCRPRKCCRPAPTRRKACSPRCAGRRAGRATPRRASRA